MQGIKKCKREKGIELFLARSQAVPGIPSYFRERRNYLRAIIHYENFNISLVGGLVAGLSCGRQQVQGARPAGMRREFAVKKATRLTLDHCTQKAFRGFAGTPESRTPERRWCIVVENILDDLIRRFQTIYS